jgi:hypothetical protein
VSGYRAFVFSWCGVSIPLSEACNTVTWGGGTSPLKEPWGYVTLRGRGGGVCHLMCYGMGAPPLSDFSVRIHSIFFWWWMMNLMNCRHLTDRGFGCTILHMCHMMQYDAIRGSSFVIWQGVGWERLMLTNVVCHLTQWGGFLQAIWLRDGVMGGAACHLTDWVQSHIKGCSTCHLMSSDRDQKGECRTHTPSDRETSLL